MLGYTCCMTNIYIFIIFTFLLHTASPMHSKCWLVGNSLELLVFPGAADLGGEPLSQFLQAARVLQLNLRFAAEELLQVLQQLDTWLRLLLQAFELFHQLVANLCPSEEKDLSQLFVLLSQQCTTSPSQKYPEKVKRCIFIMYYIIIWHKKMFSAYIFIFHKLIICGKTSASILMETTFPNSWFILKHLCMYIKRQTDRLCFLRSALLSAT